MYRVGVLKRDLVKLYNAGVVVKDLSVRLNVKAY